MTPMKKLLIIFCSFGLFIGIVFPFYASFFIDITPGKELQFKVACIISGFIVGLFCYYITKKVLLSLDRYYKEIVNTKLNICNNNDYHNEKDILVNMQKDFEKLLDNFADLLKREKEHLKEISITDGLTSLYNHRYLYDYVKENQFKDNIECTIAFCDIDNFKVINDVHGHVTGDLVLKEIGKLIKQEVAGKGKAFRYGGEEFVILLENITYKEAFKIAEEVRVGVYNNKLLRKYSIITPITISIGLASYPNHGTDVKELINKADQAMYFAKKNGKNQCYIYTTEIDNLNYKIVNE